MVESGIYYNVRDAVEVEMYSMFPPVVSKREVIEECKRIADQIIKE